MRRRRSYLTLAAVVMGHILLLVLIGGLIIFHSAPPLADNEGVAFGQTALPSRSKAAEQPADEVKSTPPVIPPPNLVQPPETPRTAPITLPSSYSTPTTFDLPSPQVKIPGLFETIHENSPPSRKPSQNEGGGASLGSPQGVPMDNLFGMDVPRDGPVIVFLDTSDSLKSLQDPDAVTKDIKKQLPACTIQEIKGSGFS